jgi:integrase
MLEDYISEGAAEQLRSGVFCAHIEGLCEHLVELGYRPITIRQKLWVVRVLGRLMAKRGDNVRALDDAYIEKSIKTRNMRRYARRQMRSTGRVLLEYLRSANAIATPEVALDVSPFAPLLARYERYLRQERAVTDDTNAAYIKVARAFIENNLRKAGARLAALKADDVCRFQLSRCQHLTPKGAQYLSSALRSFLRFLFARGEVNADLAHAVLTTRHRSCWGVPRYMSPCDVERLLDSCDLSSATGRRNHAILLLLARLGLRASEISALELGDLCWREGEIIGVQLLGDGGYRVKKQALGRNIA